MPKYIIEREIPGIGEMSQRDLKAAAMKSKRVTEELGPEIQWVQSYITKNGTHCVYIASGKEIIQEHAKLGEIPVTEISEIETIIDPVTAEHS